MRRVTRRAILGVLAITAVSVVGAGGSSARTSADLFSGTWNLAAAAGTPWSSGGTLTISAASSAAVPGATGQAAWDNYVKGYCLGPAPPGGTAPKVRAWYALAYSWSGGGKMGGCVSDKTNGQLIFFGAGSMGHITGRNGNTLIGDWTNNPNGQLKFTATLATGSPPSPAAGGRSKAVAEPAPGGTGTVSSPDSFPADAAKVDVIIVNTAGNLSGTTIVGEGERTVAQSTGELVAACWLIGPDTLPFKDKDTIKRMNEPKNKQQIDKLTAQEQLRACLYLVYVIQKGLEGTAGRTTSAAGGCRVQRLGFAIRRSAGHVVSLRLAKPTSTSVRYTCTASGGTAKITVDGRSKGGLRKALGTKLDLGVYRTKKAPRRHAKLTFAFGW